MTIGSSRGRELAARLGPAGITAGPVATLAADPERRIANAIEKAGFTALWFGESTGRECFAHAATLLAATSRLTVASAVANVYARDPMAMLAGALTLREAWNDRFVLGMGVSHVGVVERRGHGYDRPVATMRAYLDDMDRACTSWSGPAVDPPSRVLGALRPLMLRLAAERTAGAHPFFVPVDHTRRARDVLGSEPLLATEQAVVLAQDRPTARAAGGDQHAARMLEFDAYRDNLRWLGWSDSDLAPPVSDRLFDAVIAWGDREAIWERVQEHLRAGADHVSLNLIGEATEAGIRGRLEALLPIGV